MVRKNKITKFFKKHWKIIAFLILIIIIGYFILNNDVLQTALNTEIPSSGSGGSSGGGGS